MSEATASSKTWPGRIETLKDPKSRSPKSRSKIGAARTGPRMGSMSRLILALLTVAPLNVAALTLAALTLASPARCQPLEDAKRAFDKGDYALAVRLFEQAQRASPSCDNLFYAGLARYRLKQPDAAIIAFQSAVQCNPKLIPARLALAQAYAERGNDSAALASFAGVLDRDPANISALRDAASIYLKNQANQKAVPLLEKLVAADARDLAARVDLAAAYAATGDRDRAVSQFQEVLRRNPGHAGALLGLGSLFLKTGDGQQGVALLQQAANAAPNAFEPHYLLGSAFNRLGRYQEAVAELQSAVRLGGNESEVYYHLARAYAGLGRQDERRQALARFAELSRKANEDTEAQRRARQLIDEAKSLVDSGNAPEAAARLEEARELRPTDDRLLFRLASLHYDLHRNDLARSYAQEAISLAPSEWLYHYLLGLVEKRERRWAPAASSLETAARLNPQAAEVHNALGEVALETGDRRHAIASFQRAAELKPGEQAYRLNLEAARR